MESTVLNPFTGDTVATVEQHEGKALEDRLCAAVEAQRQWREVDLAERCARISRALDHFRDQQEAIARNVTLQMGKPLKEARAEVNTMLARAETMIALAPESLSRVEIPPVEGFVRRIEKVPLGVVLVIAAWNYPLLIPINTVVPALLAGNSVLLKHSARTPLTGQDFETAFSNLEPAGLVFSLALSHEKTSAVINDPRVAHVSFTGSVDGGRAVHREIGHRLIDAGLELGGKDPAYIAEDADLEFAAANVVEGACYNAGQSCCGIERAYVHRRHYDAFLDLAKKHMASLKTGDPLVGETTLGPLANPSASADLEQQVQEAVKQGARLLCGGKAASPFFPPTLVADCPQDSVLMQEESFGPILPVHPVDSDEEALQKMNDSRYGLTASVWTKDLSRAEWFAQRLDTGTVFQNRCDFLDPELPWTGVKESGKGVTLSRFGFDHLTRLKALHFRVG